MSFHNPMFYNEILRQKGLLDDIYKAVNSLDGSAVMEAYKVLTITKGFPKTHKHVKNCDRSCSFRNQGNLQYQSENYQTALEMYNKALLFAPKGSIEMLHAYGNRSALLYHLEAFNASIKDIETCRRLGCTGDLAKKLNKRYELCMQSIWKEHLKNNILLSNFAQEYFKFDVKRHQDIPCLSADVDIISEAGERKVIAAKDIKVGTVIAVETAFASYSLPDKSMVSCHYCQKTTLNLMPCETCCYALFCSEDCRERCLNEYHNIECQIMDILVTIDAGIKFRIAVQVALKLKYLCKDWSTLIKESNNIGNTRLKTSSLSDVFNVENYSSMLAFKEDRRFIFGTLYNSCFIYASVLRHLEKVSGFFPQAKTESFEAKKCFGKLCLLLQLHWVATELVTSAEELLAGQIVTDMPCHFGWFAFTGKLKHACDPNLLVLGLNNKVALVALQPIKQMTELTISYVGHWYDHQYEEQRRLKLYQNILNVCACAVCAGAAPPPAELEPKQKKVYLSWEHQRCGKGMVMPQRDAQFVRATCLALAALAGRSGQRDHRALFHELRTQLGLCQYAATTNVIINQ